MRFPYIFPVGLSVLAGALASTVAYARAYNSVGGGLVSLVQDGFVLAWGIAIANLGRDAELLRTITRAWVISATVWAALMIIGVLGHLSVLSGETARDSAAGRLHSGRPKPGRQLLHLLAAGTAGHTVPKPPPGPVVVLRADRGCHRAHRLQWRRAGSRRGDSSRRDIQDGAAPRRGTSPHRGRHAHRRLRGNRAAGECVEHRAEGPDKLAIAQRLDRSAGREQRVSQHHPGRDGAAVPDRRYAARPRARRHQERVPGSPGPLRQDGT